MERQWFTVVDHLFRPQKVTIHDDDSVTWRYTCKPSRESGRRHRLSGHLRLRYGVEFVNGAAWACHERRTWHLLWTRHVVAHVLPKRFRPAYSARIARTL